MFPPGSASFRKQGLHLQSYYPNSPMLHNATPQHPMTPLDFSYSQSMLPANLLSTPSPYVGNGHFMPPVFSPHPAQFDVQLPRTVVFSGLPAEVSVQTFLDHLEYGPLESCRVGSRDGKSVRGSSRVSEASSVTHAGPDFSSGDSSSGDSSSGDSTEISFYVSYFNHPTALQCLQKYTHDADDFRQKLSCPNLHISFDSPEAARALKPKICNYVADHEATRALAVRFKIIDSDLVPLMEKAFKTRCLNFGDLDSFDVTEEASHIVFVVHFLAIDSAIKIYDYQKKRIARSDSANDVELVCASVHFHKDRCERQETLIPPAPESEGSFCRESVANDLSLHEEERSDVSSNSVLSDYSPNHSHPDVVAARESHGYSYPVAPPFMQMPSFPYNPDPVNDCNRTLCLGNLSPKTTVEEIANNVRAGGLVQSIKYYRNKRVCFITFVDPAIALKFYLNHQVIHQLVIRDQVVSVNWGRTHSGPLAMNIAYAVASGASRNVYIGLKLSKGRVDKPKLPDEKTLRADFSHFGELEQINYVHNKDCGFMNFMNIADAIKVVSYFETENQSKIAEIVGDNGETYEKYRVFKISFGKDRCGNPLKFSFKKTDRVEEQERPRRPRTPKETPENSISEEAAMVFGIQTPSRQKGEAKDTEEKPTDDAVKACGDNDEVKSDINEDNSDTEVEDDIAIIIEADTPVRPRTKPKKKTQKVYHDDNLDLTGLLSAAWSSYGYGYGYQQPMYMVPGTMNKDARYEAMPGMMTYPYANQYGSHGYGSGSQIMAQYLAKSQQENALLASTVQETRRRKKEAD